MLNAYPKPPNESASLSSRNLADHVWVDLIHPTEAELSAFERASGLSVPSKDELGEIEATSRLKIKSNALYMTAPLIFAEENEPWLPTPVGFVLSKQLLMTVRFAESPAFDAVAKETSAAEKPDPTAVFVRLLEEQIDHLADLLELASRDLDDASRTVFRPDHEKLSRQSAHLRRLMISTARTSERMARIQYTLVCLDRMAKFTTDRAHDWLKPDMAARLHSICSDTFAGAVFRRPCQPRSAPAGRRGRHH